MVYNNNNNNNNRRRRIRIQGSQWSGEDRARQASPVEGRVRSNGGDWTDERVLIARTDRTGIGRTKQDAI